MVCACQSFTGSSDWELAATPGAGSYSTQTNLRTRAAQREFLEDGAVGQR